MKKYSNINFEEIHGRKMLYFHEQEAEKNVSRRKISRNKKAKRFQMASEGNYRYPGGYWVKTEKMVGEKRTEIVPAQTRPIYSKDLVAYPHISTYNDDVVWLHEYVTRQIGIENIPEHERTYKVHHWISITPRLKRSRISKKSYRKMFERTIRHLPFDETPKRGGYRKVEDLWWSID